MLMKKKSGYRSYWKFPDNLSAFFKFWNHIKINNHLKYVPVPWLYQHGMWN